MPHAIRIHVHGGPEILRWEPVAAAVPGPREVLIRQTAIGLNFIDVYERTGLYPGALPMGLGREAAGVVEEIGPRVRGIAVGDRVAYASNQPGAYAQERVMPADRVVRIPDGVSRDRR
jgi:NADPH2:quinone reductase